MATAIINGRRVQVPPVAKVEDIRKAGGIADGRNVIRRTREWGLRRAVAAPDRWRR